MNSKAIIFDLDGTIIDTKRIWQKATETILSNRKITLNKQDYANLDRELCGIGMYNSCSILKNKFKLTDSLSTLIEEKKGMACKLYKQNLQFVPGFELFHAAVTKKGLKCSIATSSDRKNFNTAKQLLNLEKFFGNHMYDIACVDNKPKPDPAVYLFAAKKLAVAPKHCIAIEDSPAGISAAKKSGMFCIGIDTNGIRNQMTHADIIIDQYDEIDLENLIERK